MSRIFWCAASIAVFVFPLKAIGQIYKSGLVCIEEEEKFKIIGRQAYLDYNLDEKYVELAYKDTLYHYEIRNTPKQKDPSRFIVWFKKTNDTMLWNTSEQGDYIFAFNIGEVTLWFRELEQIDKTEFSDHTIEFIKKTF